MMINITFNIARILLIAVIAVIFAIHYKKSRQQAFLWLAVPLVVFPLVGLAISYFYQVSIDKVIAGNPNVIYPFTLVNEGRISIGELISITNWMRRTFYLLGEILVIIGLFLLKPYSGRNDAQ